MHTALDSRRTFRTPNKEHRFRKYVMVHTPTQHTKTPRERVSAHPRSRSAVEHKRTRAVPAQTLDRVPANARAAASTTAAARASVAPLRKSARSRKRSNAPASKHSLVSQFSQLVAIILTICSKRIWVFVLVVLAIVVGIAGPVRDYYVAKRTGSVLEQKKASIDEKNAELEHDREKLMTEDGIQEEARKRGYVEPGEVGVSVEGIDKSPQVDPSQVSIYPDTRDEQTKFFDGIFGFDPTLIWNKR